MATCWLHNNISRSLSLTFISYNVKATSPCTGVTLKMSPCVSKIEKTMPCESRFVAIRAVVVCNRV